MKPAPPPQKPSASSPTSAAGSSSTAEIRNRKNNNSNNNNSKQLVTTAHLLHDAELYEAVKKILPDCTAVDSIKLDHRSRSGVNVSKEEGDDPSNTELSIDEQIKQIRDKSENWERDQITSSTNASLANQQEQEEAKHSSEAAAQIRIRELEECLARVQEHFSMADAVEEEYRGAEERRFAKEKQELAERTQQRIEHARQLVKQADNAAERREKEAKFLDRETSIAELVFKECIERQTNHKQEEARRVALFKECLEHKHYLVGIQDLRQVVQNAWVEGVSQTSEWKQWADVLAADAKLPPVAGASSAGEVSPSATTVAES